MDLSNASPSDLAEPRTGISAFVLGEIVRRVASTPGVERAALYGSRARGDQRRHSDIDIALFGPVTRAEVGILKDRLDDSPIIFPIDVTAVDALPEGHLLRQQIEQDGVTIYERAA